ncbi:MAG: elongation factor 1-beta [Nanoarchaeota archaeon]|nr:elongation factor 1-beta [Nanoarchaeota archaeon]
MAGIVAVIVKIMPDSPEEDLEKIKADAKVKLEEDGARNISFEEEPVAFGLKAIKAKFAWDEDKEGEIYEKKLGEIAGVSSVDTVDYRRAFG